MRNSLNQQKQFIRIYTATMCMEKYSNVDRCVAIECTADNETNERKKNNDNRFL